MGNDMKYFRQLLKNESTSKVRNAKNAKNAKTRVFLGGTCNESTWRNDMMKLLESSGIGYFNPVDDDWTEDDYKKELQERKDCDVCLYVITPKMTGVYSIAEVTDDSNKRPEKTVFIILENDDNKTFNKSELKSLNAVKKMVQTNGANCFDTFESCVDWLKTV